MAYAAPHVVAARPRRGRSVPGLRDRLGHDDRLPPAAVGARPRRRRGPPRAGRTGHARAAASARSNAARDISGARLAAACGTEGLAAADLHDADTLLRTYETQMEAVEKLGGRPDLRAGPALARPAHGWVVRAHCCARRAIR
jgi:hypothetical protein